MNWFRMYHEARNDAKLNTLNDRQFRIWFKLLCYAAEQPERGVIQDFDVDLLTVELTCSLTEFEETLTILKKLRIVENGNSDLTFINFRKRHFVKPSDEPEAVRVRVQKHRNAVKRPVTPSVTTTEQNRTDNKDQILFNQFWSAWPNKVAKKEAEKAWDKNNCPEISDQIIAAIIKQSETRRLKKERKEFIPEWPNPATWLNGQRWLDEISVVEPAASTERRKMIL